jgi:hypothetical protein
VLRRPQDDEPIIANFIISEEFTPIAPRLRSDGRHNFIRDGFGY